MKFEDAEIFATGRRYLVSPCPRNDKTQGGLYLPENRQERMQIQGIVRELGTHVPAGKEDAYHCAVNDRVIFSPHSGASIQIGEETWKVLGELDIVAVIRPVEKKRNK